VPIDQVVVTVGSNQLLYLVSDVLLDPGDIVLCGAPTYFVYLGTLVNLGAKAVGVQVDEYGTDGLCAGINHDYMSLHIVCFRMCYQGFKPRVLPGFIMPLGSRWFLMACIIAIFSSPNCILIQGANARPTPWWCDRLPP